MVRRLGRLPVGFALEVLVEVVFTGAGKTGAILTCLLVGTSCFG
jgi:hypothetical protein